MAWNLSEAKNRFSEVLTRAATEGPQTIQRRNEYFVVLPKVEYEKLAGQLPAFKDWLLNGPTLEGVDIRRDRSDTREVDL